MNVSCTDYVTSRDISFSDVTNFIGLQITEHFTSVFRVLTQNWPMDPVTNFNISSSNTPLFTPMREGGGTCHTKAPGLSFFIVPSPKSIPSISLQYDVVVPWAQVILTYWILVAYRRWTGHVSVWRFRGGRGSTVITAKYGSLHSMDEFSVSVVGMLWHPDYDPKHTLNDIAILLVSFKKEYHLHV